MSWIEVSISMIGNTELAYLLSHQFSKMKQAYKIRTFRIESSDPLKCNFSKICVAKTTCDLDDSRCITISIPHVQMVRDIQFPLTEVVAQVST